MADEIEEILKFDPGAQRATPEEDEISEILKFDPVGGTFRPPEKPPPGAPTPAAPFPGYPGAYREYTEPTEEPAGFLTMADASTVTDPATKVGIFAKARGMTLAEAAQRYRLGKNGEIEFKTDVGQWQREIPEDLMSQAKGMAAAIAGHPSTVTGTAGAVVAGPPGAVGGAVAGELLRQTYARVRHDEPQTLWGNLGNVLIEGTLALGGEMVGKVFAGTINRFKTRKAPRILRRAGSEIPRGVLTAEDHARAEYLKAIAGRHDIDLLPHQLYDKQSLTNMWMYLRKHPLTSDAVQQFDDALENQTKEAMESFIQQMGGYQEEAFEIGTKLKKTATEAGEELREARAETAEPYYAAAFDDTPKIDTDALQREFEVNRQSIARAEASTEPDVDAMVAELRKDDPYNIAMRQKGESQASYAERITRDYRRETGKQPPMGQGEKARQNIEGFRQRNAEIESILAGEEPPKGAYVPLKGNAVDITPIMAEVDRILTKEVVKGSPSYNAVFRIKRMLKNANNNPQLIDNIKQEGIDEVLNKAKVKPAIRRRMAIIKKQLTDTLDEQIPDYAAARGIWGKWGMGKPIDDFKLSVLDQISRAETPADIENAVNKIFGKAKVPSFEGVRRARDLIVKQDPDLWRRTVAHYIRNIYDNLTVTEGGTLINNAGKMNKMLFGNPNRQKTMAVAFGGANSPEYKSFKDLMEVLQRASAGKAGQSMTQPFSAIEKRMAGGAEAAKRFFKNPYDTAVERAFDWWNDVLLSGRQEDLLRALTDPQVQSQIAQIRPLTPKSRRYIEAFTTATALIQSKIEGYQLPDQQESQTGPRFLLPMEG